VVLSLALPLVLWLPASASTDAAAAGQNCALGPRGWLQRLDEWPPRAAGNHFCAETTWLQVLRAHAARWGASGAHCGPGKQGSGEGTEEERNHEGAAACECLRLRAQVVAARLNAGGPLRAANLSREELAPVEQAEETAGTACCRARRATALDTRRAHALLEALREFNGEQDQAPRCSGAHRVTEPRATAKDAAGQGVMRPDGAYAHFVYESFASRVLSHSGVALVAYIVVGALVFILAARLRARFVLQHGRRRQTFGV
jgi:hypothetical protein